MEDIWARITGAACAKNRVNKESLLERPSVVLVFRILVHFSSDENKLTGMYSCQVYLALMQMAFVLGAVYLKYSINHEDSVQRLHPVNFAFARETIAGMILCSVAFLTTKSAPLREDLPQFLILGTCLFCGQLFYILGVEHSRVVVASCMQPAIPVFTATIAISLGKESLSVRRSLGIITASVGAICMIDGSEGTHLTQTLGATSQAVLGSFFLLLNTVAMALYYVLCKSVLANYPPIAVPAWTYIIAASMTGITALVYNRFYQIDWYLPRDAYGPLMYWILVCSVGKYYILSWALSILPSTQVATFQCLQPLAGTVLGFIVLGEHLSFWDLGAIGIVAGLLIVNRTQTADLKQLNDSEVLKFTLIK